VEWAIVEPVHWAVEFIGGRAGSILC